MRIRKRPPPSPSITHPSLQNGRQGSKNSTAAAGGGLHPVGDLPIDPHETGKNPKTRPTVEGSSSSSLPDPYLLASPFLATRELVQVLEEVKEVDSSKKCNAQAYSSSCSRTSGSSGAVAAVQVRGTMTSPLQKRTWGENEIGNADGGLETKPTEHERKEKVKARTSGAAANNSCTSVKDEGSDVGNGSGKRRRSPAVLLEGSRCSRVNGRGWRCCQQTLVGYSLCEHHLGKGRLRSVSSVRGQLGTSKPKWSIDARNGVVPSTSSPPERNSTCAGLNGLDHKVEVDEEEEDVDDDDDDEEEEEEEEETARKTRKKKIVMVKARSISSLLDHFEVSSASSPPREGLTNEAK